MVSHSPWSSQRDRVRQRETEETEKGGQIEILHRKRIYISVRQMQLSSDSH